MLATCRAARRGAVTAGGRRTGRLPSHRLPVRAQSRNLASPRDCVSTALDTNGVGERKVLWRLTWRDRDWRRPALAATGTRRRKSRTGACNDGVLAANEMQRTALETQGAGRDPGPAPMTAARPVPHPPSSGSARAAIAAPSGNSRASFSATPVSRRRRASVASQAIASAASA